MRLGAIAVEPIMVDGNVDVNHIAILQHRTVRNAMAHYFVHGGAA
jgi:hypothetical protein